MDENSEGWDSSKKWGDDKTCSDDQFAAMKAARETNPKAYEFMRPQPALDSAVVMESLMGAAAGTIAPTGTVNVAKLRDAMRGDFAIRLSQTAADFPLAAHKPILLQTQGASARNPYILTFNQLILTPFTGEGQFDLAERDLDDVDVLDDEGNLVSGGETEVTLATAADGFTAGIAGDNGWSQLVIVITADKYYRINFVPGDAGDGIYQVHVRGVLRDPSE